MVKGNKFIQKLHLYCNNNTPFTYNIDSTELGEFVHNLQTMQQIAPVLKLFTKMHMFLELKFNKIEFCVKLNILKIEFYVYFWVELDIANIEFHL